MRYDEATTTQEQGGQLHHPEGGDANAHYANFSHPAMDSDD